VNQISSNTARYGGLQTPVLSQEFPFTALMCLISIGAQRLLVIRRIKVTPKPTYSATWLSFAVFQCLNVSTLLTAS
jgi:hypothetical protein